MGGHSKKIGGWMYQIHGNFTTRERAIQESKYLRNILGKKAHMKSEKMPWGETHYLVWKR